MSGELGRLTIELSANVARLQSDMGKAAQVARDAAAQITGAIAPISKQFDSVSGRVAIAAGKFSLITMAIREVSAAAKSLLAPAMDAVENYNASVIKSAAMITSLQGAKGGNIAETYKQAKQYASALQEELIEMDARSIASARQIGLMNEEFIKGGILLDINNKKQKEGFENIANALAVIAAGSSNANLQFSQEIRGMLSGVDRPENALFRQLQAIDPLLKEHLKTWKELGTLIENVGNLLIGYRAASGDISSLWTTIKSTFSTITDQILRGGMVVAFTDIVKSAQTLTQWVKDHKEQIGLVINKGWLVMKGVIQSIGAILEPLAPMLRQIGTVVAVIADGWGMIGAVALPTVVEKLVSMVKMMAFFGEIARSTLAMFVDFIGVIGSGIAAIGIAAFKAMTGDFKGAQETMSSVMTTTWGKALEKNAANTRETFNALKSEFSGLLDMSGFDRRLSEYNKSGFGKQGAVKTPKINAAGKPETGSQSVGNFNSVVEMWNSLNIKAEQDEFLRVIEENEKKFSDLVTKFNAEIDKSGLASQGITLKSIMDLKDSVDHRLVSDAAGSEFDKWYDEQIKQNKASIELAKKTAQEKKAVAESEAHNAIASIEAMEKYGDISSAEAARGMIGHYKNILAAQQEFLSGTSRANDPGGWIAQQNAIDRTREKITDLQRQIAESTVLGGISAGMKDYAKAAMDLGSQMKNFTMQTFSRMEDGLTKFVMTGKFAFKDLANAIIEDLVRIAIRASITGPLASAMGSFNFGSMFSAAGGFDIPSGLNPVTQLHQNEMVLPAQYADVIRDMAATGGGGGTPEIQINVINKSSQPVNANSGGGQFDGKKFVINTILEDVANNGPMRGLMASGGAY